MLKGSVRKTCSQSLCILGPSWKEQEGHLVTLPDCGTQATNPSDFGSPLSETGAAMGRPQDVPGAYKWGKKSA